MDANVLWLLVLSISTPVAGVVGFAIQLRQIRKARLENEKLLLEIAALKAAAETRNQVIQRVTTDEVLRFGHGGGMYSRGPISGLDDGPVAARPSKVTEALVIGAVVGLVIMVVGYALYDLYRLAKWIASAV